MQLNETDFACNNIFILFSETAFCQYANLFQIMHACS